MKQPNRVEIKEKAKEILKGNIWNIWKPLIVIAAISLAVSLLVDNVFTKTVACPTYEGLIDSSFWEGTTCTEVTLVGYLINVLFSLVSIVLSVGFTSYLLNLIRKKEFSLKNDLFKYFKENLGLCLATGILVSLFTTLWTLLLIVPGIIAAISYAMWTPLVVDGSTGSLDTIRKSKKMMYGHKWNYFVFLLSFIGWLLLGVVTFGIAYIYVIPYMSVAQMLYYEELKKMNK